MPVEITLHLDEIKDLDELTKLAAALDDQHLGQHQSAYTLADCIVAIVNGGDGTVGPLQNTLSYWVSAVDGKSTYPSNQSAGQRAWIDADESDEAVAARMATLGALA